MTTTIITTIGDTYPQTYTVDLRLHRPAGHVVFDVVLTRLDFSDGDHMPLDWTVGTITIQHGGSIESTASDEDLALVRREITERAIEQHATLAEAVDSLVTFAALNRTREQDHDGEGTEGFPTRDAARTAGALA